MSPAKPPTETETWLLLASLVFDHRHAWRTQVSERTGLPFSRFRALRRIETGPLTGTQLAERLDVDAAATSVIVSDLARRGLATKTTDPDDGRRRVVVITDAGRAVMDHLRQSADAAPFLGALTDDERATLYGLLKKMQEAAQ